MEVKLQYTLKARDDLSAFDAKDRIRIFEKLEYYCFTSSPMKHARALRGPLKGLHRFRIGEYRAIFQKDSKGRVIIITVVRIKHRKEIYL